MRRFLFAVLTALVVTALSPGATRVTFTAPAFESARLQFYTSESTEFAPAHRGSEASTTVSGAGADADRHLECGPAPAAMHILAIPGLAAPDCRPATVEGQRWMRERVWTAANVQLASVTLDTHGAHLVWRPDGTAQGGYNPKNRANSLGCCGGVRRERLVALCAAVFFGAALKLLVVRKNGLREGEQALQQLLGGRELDPQLAGMKGDAWGPGAGDR